jgi:serine/threonine protein kinase
MPKSRTIADHFEIIDLERDLLDSGSMGDIYRGIDTQTGQAVAIKALKPDLMLGSPDLVARFAREGEILRRLDHPNIVRMVAALEDRGRPYLIMEYVGGGSLQDLLETQGTLTIERALDIAGALANALSLAHRRGIFHRDLKPTNVLLAEDGTPRLTDFGVAYIVDSERLTKTGMRIGTANYFSPEVCNGETPDERADIWALGVMLYEMMTGERPFSGDSIGATAVAILTQPVPDVTILCPGVSPTLTDLLYAMLEKDRYKRIPSMRLVEIGLNLEARLHERRRIASPFPTLQTRQ